MSTSILVLGHSGTGKSTSARNLKPEETFIISMINKDLPFRGWRKTYTQLKKEGDKFTGNFVNLELFKKPEEKFYPRLLSLLQIINNSMPHIKNVIIDDFQNGMVSEFMERSTEKGFDKFSQIQTNAWMALDATKKLRDDVTVFINSHIEKDADGGESMMTIGKMLKEKFVPEAMFSIVLYTTLKDDKYFFRTHNNGNNTCKSPDGMFDAEIPNDFAFVKECISKYDN